MRLGEFSPSGGLHSAHLSRRTQLRRRKSAQSVPGKYPGSGPTSAARLGKQEERKDQCQTAIVFYCLVVRISLPTQFAGHADQVTTCPCFGICDITERKTERASVEEQRRKQKRREGRRDRADERSRATEPRHGAQGREDRTHHTTDRSQWVLESCCVTYSLDLSVKFDN